MRTDCPNCKWPHYSQIATRVTCYRCGSAVDVAGEPNTEHKKSRLVAIVSKLRTPEDRGVGDTLERLLAKAGGRKFKHLMLLMRLPCGCDDRQAWLNERFPYS
jgi:hypothetical protein